MSELLDLAVRLATGLERAGVPYAIGGAIALGYYAPPRGTLDIDLNLFVRPEEARPVLERLREMGVEIEPDVALTRLEERGDHRASIGGVRLDLFVDSIPLHETAFRRRRRVELQGNSVWILSAEDLLVLKLLFFRPKDLDDCRRMIALQGAGLDRRYARGQLMAHVGENDVRVCELDRMLEELEEGQ